MQFKFSIRRNLLIAAMIILPMLLMTLGWHDVIAQNATATGVLIVVPTLTATDVKKVTPTPSLTATDAAPGLARIEAKSKDTGANLRAAPSTESEKLGTIFPGQFYGVIGRFGKWLEIQYDKSPTGLAWVYEDIVNVTGLDPAAIATLSPNTVPSPNVATGAAQATLNVLTTTPGGPETATALQASATGVFTRTAGGTDEPTLSGPQPTFTFPAAFVEATLPPRAAASNSQGGVPPIVPIIALAGVGLFGLLVSALRRL